MRDVLLITPQQSNTEWNLDIDIRNGRPVMVPEERSTQDQRAAVAAYMFKGSVPGKPDMGVNWSALYEPNYEETLITIDNELKQNIQQLATTPAITNGMYVPLYNLTEDGIELSIFQG